MVYNDLQTLRRESWGDYEKYGRWPYYRVGALILDGKSAAATRRYLRPWSFITLTEGMQN